MNALTRSQKAVLLVLALLDVLVICGLGAIVFSSGLRPAQTAPSTEPATATSWAVATWTPTPTLTPRPTLQARPTNTPTPTTTPPPTATPTDTPTPTPTATLIPREPVELSGAEFDFLLPNRIPGWTWDAYINYKPGEDYDPNDAFAEPMFTGADDAARQINGSTLKVETMRWLKFRTWVHQTLDIPAGSSVQFRIKAKAYSSLDRLIVKAGIDPTGAGNCYNARWGQEQTINQDDGTVVLTSPAIIVPAQPSPVTESDGDGEEAAQVPALGPVTVCFFAESRFPHVNNAAFFDQAELIIR